MNSKRFEGLRPFTPVVVCAALMLFVSPLDAQQRRQVIEVHTVDELYAAVNGGTNCGTTASCAVTIHLAPGTYLLSEMSTDGPRNVLRPNAGALRLQPGISLVGSEEHVDTNGDGVLDPIDPADPDVFAVPGTETLIDGSQLILEPEERADCAGESRPIFPDPVIYIGRNNTISALSVVGVGNIAIGEPTNDPIDPTGSLSIEITDTVITSDLVAVDFSNSECAARRARSVLHFSHNVVRHAGAFGVGITNFYTGDASNDPSDGPEIQATVAYNLFTNNGTALRAAAGDEGTDGGSVTVHMTGNVFRNNLTNLQGRGGVGRLVLPTVGNRLFVTSESDTFGEAPSSVYLTAGSGDGQDGSLKAEFFDSRFIRDSPDTPPEISIIGDEGSGSDNHAAVLITHATVKTSDGVAVEGALLIEDEAGSVNVGSIARLEGSREDFILNNQGLPAPPAYFFLAH